jgi:DNA-binding IclR family transcriptional regulator
MKNWETILKILYEHEDDWEYFADGETGIVSDHPLVDKAGLSASSAKAGLSFLQEHELVYQTRDGGYRLTTEGFETARKQEMRRTQARQNRTIAVLTVVIAIAAILEILI